MPQWAMDSMTAPRTRPSYASQTLAKGLRLLEALVRDGGRSTLSAVAARLALPPRPALLAAAALLLVALAIGLIISIFQAATQINEATLSFIPKLVGTLLVLLLAGPWMLQLFVDYIRQLFEKIPLLIG